MSIGNISNQLAHLLQTLNTNRRVCQPRHQRTAWRKLIRHTLGRWLEAKNFAGNFDVQRRAQEIPVTEYLALVQQL